MSFGPRILTAAVGRAGLRELLPRDERVAVRRVPLDEELQRVLRRRVVVLRAKSLRELPERVARGLLAAQVGIRLVGALERRDRRERHDAEERREHAVAREAGETG